MQITYTEDEVKQIVATHVQNHLEDVIVDTVVMVDDGAVHVDAHRRENPKLAVPVPNQKMTR